MIPQPQLLHPEREQPVVSLSSGKRLQKSREERGMSQADVANSLRLPLNVIQALDEDRHDGIHTTYLKGYLRSYARLVGVSTDLVVADIRQTLADRQAEILRAQAAPPPLDTSHTIIKLVTFGLCAGLLLLGLTWWKSQNADQLTDSQTAPDVADPAVPEPVPLIPTLAANPTAAAEATADGTVPSPVPSASAPASTEAQTVVETAASTSGAVGNAASSLSQVASPPPTAVAADRPVATSRTSPPAAIPSSDPTTGGLVLKITEEAWIDITDAGGKRVAKKLAAAGEVIQLTNEQAPYRMVLGNASAIVLAFDGKPIPLQAMARNGVVRFRVGADGTVHR